MIMTATSVKSKTPLLTLHSHPDTSLTSPWGLAPRFTLGVPPPWASASDPCGSLSSHTQRTVLLCSCHPTVIPHPTLLFSTPFCSIYFTD